MKHLLAVIVALVAFNCSAFNILQDNHIGTEIRYYCEPKLERNLLNALTIWNVALDGKLKVSSVNKPMEATLIVRILPDFRGNGWSPEVEGAIGFTMYDPGLKMTWISINGLIYNDYNKDALLLHELGHMFGLAHSDDRNSIMFPYLVDYPELCEDDVAGIRSLYGLTGPIALDFKVKVVQHKVFIESMLEDAKFIIDDTSRKYKGSFDTKLKPGDHVIKMNYHGLVVRHEVTIK